MQFTSTEIDSICSVCRTKLKDFYEYFCFVLSNQEQFKKENLTHEKSTIVKDELYDESKISNDQTCSLPYEDEGENSFDESQMVVEKLEDEDDVDYEPDEKPKLFSENTSQPPATRKRGRPKKLTSPQVSKSKRGRPRTEIEINEPSSDKDNEDNDSDFEFNIELVHPPPKKRREPIPLQDQNLPTAICTPKKTHIPKKRLTPLRPRLFRDRCKLTPEQQRQREVEDEYIHKFFYPKCPECPTMPAFRDINRLAIHVDLFHNMNFSISCCNQSFNKRGTYLHHLKINHMTEEEPNTYPCDDCGVIFTSWKRIRNHRFLFHDYCVECQAYVKIKKTSIKSHMQQHAFATVPGTLAPFICHYCNKQLKDRSKLKYHLEANHLKKVVAMCHLCGINFVSMSGFTQHNLRLHGGGITKIPCPVCGIAVRETYIETHIANTHNQDDTPASCPICHKEFKRETLMKTHLYRAHGERKYQCQYCTQKFKTRKMVREHEAVHTGIPLYKCEWCAAEFKSCGNYGAHRRKLHPVEYEAQKKMNLAKKYEL